jgi:PAS domain S-box-containing protein
MINNKDFKITPEERNMFFELSIDMICMLDSDRKFKIANPAFYTTLNYKSKELIGRKITDFVHEDDLQITENALQLLHTKKSKIQFENRFRCKNGSFKWFSWTIAVNSDNIYANVRDITDYKLNNELISEKKMICKTKRKKFEPVL